MNPPAGLLDLKSKSDNQAAKTRKQLYEEASAIIVSCSIGLAVQAQLIDDFSGK
jgi:hypothetical protein